MSEEIKEREWIAPVTESTRGIIQAKTVTSLPNNPSERGMSADQIKAAFWRPVTDAEYSVLAELERVIREANAVLSGLDSELDTSIDGMNEVLRTELEKNRREVTDALERLLATGMTNVELATVLESIGGGMGKGALLLNEVKTNLAGCRGYYWTAIDTRSKRIYLCRTQVSPIMGAEDYAEYADETFETPAYAVGDTIAIVNNNKFFTEATIAAIRNNVITYAGELGFDHIIPVDTGVYDVDDYSLFVLAKPEVGMVPIKRAALAAGQHNRALGNASVAINTDNETYGDHGFAYNYGNKAAWAASAGGYGNESNGYYSDTVGRDNVNDAECGRMAGRENKSTKNAYGADVSGNGNVADSDYVHISGKGNRIEAGVQKSTGSSATGEGNRIQGALNSEISGKENTIKGSTASNQWGGSQSSVGGLGNELDGTNTGAVNVHLHGERNKASHRNADVGGKGNRSSAPNQTVRGVYNEDDPDALLIVGNGESDTKRSNAFEVLHNDGVSALKVGETVVTEEELKKLQNKYTVQGLYLFNETLDTGNVQLECDVNFSCRGVTYSKLTIDMSQGMISYNDYCAWSEGFWNGGEWRSNGSNCLIYFGLEPQEVPKEVYDYLMANGKLSPAGNATFTLIENGSDVYTVGVFPYEKGMTWSAYINSAYNLDPGNMFSDYNGYIYWYISDGGYSLYSAENRDSDGRPTETVDQIYDSNPIEYPYCYFSN